MRYGNSALKLLALVAATTYLGACGGGEKPAPTMDSAAAAAAAAPPPPESFALVAEDGSSWSADIAPSGIVFRRKRDSLMFDFKPPTVNGAISDYESLMMGKDTVRITISLATAKCTDKQGKEHTHMAQLYLTGKVQLQSKGCADKKM